MTPAADLQAPMRPAAADQPALEQQIRRFLARYRCPGPPGAEWKESHVAHLLRSARQANAPAPIREGPT